MLYIHTYIYTLYKYYLFIDLSLFLFYFYFILLSWLVSNFSENKAMIIFTAYEQKQTCKVLVNTNWWLFHDNVKLIKPWLKLVAKLVTSQRSLAKPCSVWRMQTTLENDLSWQQPHWNGAKQAFYKCQLIVIHIQPAATPTLDSERTVNLFSRFAFPASPDSVSQRKRYCACDSESCSVMSNSLRPQGLCCPWNSLGQNTGVDNLSLLQGIFPGIDPRSPTLQADFLPAEPQGKSTVF